MDGKKKEWEIGISEKLKGMAKEWQKEKSSKDWDQYEWRTN